MNTQQTRDCYLNLVIGALMVFGGGFGALGLDQAFYVYYPSMPYMARTITFLWVCFGLGALLFISTAALAVYKEETTP
jgi:hypothetical protein